MVIYFSIDYEFSFTDDATLLFDCVIRVFDTRFELSFFYK